MTSAEFFVLVALTLFLIWYTWYISLKEKRYHGITRFLSFESITVLVILNYRVWFNDAFSVIQIISWLLLSGSLYFALAGYLLLKKHGKAAGKFENTTRVINNGIYSYIRHPMYLSLILLGFGAVLKNPGLIQWTLGIVNFIALYFTARIEEGEMLKRFGENYIRYKRETKII